MRITQRTFFWITSAAMGFGLGLWLAALSAPDAAHAFNPQPEPPGYAAIGLWQDTTLRINLVNVAMPDAAGVPPSPCAAEVQFFDEMGNSLGRISLPAVQAGQIASADLMFPAGRAGRMEVHPVIQFMRGDTTCKSILSSAEVFDSMGATQVFVNPVVLKGFNPQPEPPGIAGIGE